MGVETGPQPGDEQPRTTTERVPEPPEEPPVTEDDIRRAEELVEELGLQHLREKR